MTPGDSRSLASWRRQAVRRLRASRAETLALVARLTRDQVREPRTQDRWSVKDVLGHLMACDEETVRRLALIAKGRDDRIHWFEDMADADRFNARSVARARRLTMPAVLRRMARVRADLIERLERLPVDSLRDPSHAYPVVDWLPEPGWTHERDHAREIRAWWRSQRRPARASTRRRRAAAAPSRSAR